MKSLFVTTFHFLRIVLHILKTGSTKSLIAENMALRQQLIVVKRRYKRAPNLTMWDRLIFAFTSGIILPRRLLQTAIVIKPTTLLKWHKALVDRKYRNLYSNKTRKKPGPKGPSQELITLIIQMKQKNPNFGCFRIAMQINGSFGLNINKDVVRRVLAKHFKDHPKSPGPSWLTSIGHIKDSLWSLDLFRCESIGLKTHWIMVVMDQFSRKIVGFAVHAGDVDGVAVCILFNKIQSGKKLPKYLSSDNDPLFKFHRWRANLRIIDVDEIKSVPYTPTSHPFIERLIGTCRREMLDRILFWNARDLQKKLDDFKQYYNAQRNHMGINCHTPANKADNIGIPVVDINHYRWKQHCRGLFDLPVAA